jgi:hypothetical protein
MRLFIINLFFWFGWLCNIVFAQFEVSETVTGSASFPDVGITSLGNLAVFITSLLRGRLDLEMGARDLMATITGPKLYDINEFGLTTCIERKYGKASVVMLANQAPNSSIKQFMKYISNAHHVDSILLQCNPLKSTEFTAEKCECRDLCRCIVLCTVKEVTNLLARRMPATVKHLSESRCLLPCLGCLTKRCHGYNQGQGLLPPKEELTEDLMHVESGAAAVCETLDYNPWGSMQGGLICICIPMHRRDGWTKMLIRSLKSKDKEDRGVTVIASDALETYMSQSGGSPFKETEEYNATSLVVPRLTEVLVNLILTGWFRLDGFSSSLVARRAIRDYVVDSKGSGLAANAFLTQAEVKSNSNNTDVCQLLTFRGNLLGMRTLSFVVGSVNLICSISWALLVVFEGGPGKWYDKSMPPSKPRVVVIMAAIVISLAMDCLDLILKRLGDGFRWKISGRKLPMLWAVIVLDIVCIVLLSTVAKTFGMKAFGKWIYSALQTLVWVKWGVGSYLLGEYSPEYNTSRRSWGNEGGILVYTSAFLLNAILAGVRGKWQYRIDADD